MGSNPVGLLVVTCCAAVIARAAPTHAVNEAYQRIQNTTIIPSCLAPKQAGYIPPRLIQIWDTDKAPPELEPMAALWRSIDGWTSHIISDAQNEKLIAREYPWLLSVFQSYDKQVQRADIARLAQLHSKGGVYSDLDARPCSTNSKHLEKVLGPQQLTLVLSPMGFLTNFFISSVARHPFLDFALHRAPAALEEAERKWARSYERRKKSFEGSHHRGEDVNRSLEDAKVRFVTMEATGPHFFDRTWVAFLDSSPKCRNTWRATTRVFTFAEWTRQVGVHEWASTWQGTQRGPDLGRFKNSSWKAPPTRTKMDKTAVCADVEQ